MRKTLLLILLALTMLFAIGCEPNNQDPAGLQDGACNTIEDCKAKQFCDTSGYCKADACADSFCGENSSGCTRLSETTYECKCNENYFENDSQTCVTPCQSDSCGTGTHCRATSATEFECGCQLGYQDNDNDGDCTVDCETSTLKCDTEHTTACDDTIQEQQNVVVKQDIKIMIIMELV